MGVVVTSTSRSSYNNVLTYKETLDYIYAKLPMYQRLGTSAFKKDLTNIIKLCNALDNPQDQFKSIHIAGTNGKGSTSHILSAIYQQNDYKVGLYTSPHLLDFRERIKLNGELCSKDFVIDFVAKIKPHIEAIKPSFFEITVAMAFSYFAEEKVDIAIIETGLGGRLDSTNILNPIASIITSIGLDHKDMLGDTLELIAGEKAGIINRGIPVIHGNIAESPLQVIRDKATAIDAPIYSYLKDTFNTDLAGKHQQWNIGCALRCVDIVKTILPVNSQFVSSALLDVRGTSNFVGRWQILNTNPLVVSDVGHNEEGFRLIAEQLIELKLNAYYVLGFVKGKDLNKIAPLLPNGKEYHFVKPEVIRGMSADEASKAFTAPSSAQKYVHLGLEKALTEVYDSASSEPELNMIFIGGSNFVIADLLLLNEEGKTPWKL